jgi:copper resistance protein B
MMAWGRGSLALLDELEYSLGRAGRPVGVDGLAWVGGAYNRLWARTDGEQRTDGRGGEGDAELFYGRLISPYWDALIGARVDARWGEGDTRARGFLAIGLQGLAPMRFEFAPTLYVSQQGDVAARLKASYQLLVTQRVILEPEATLDAAARPSEEFARASGLTDVALTTRVRYEIRREFAPYVGVSWVRQTGGTAQLARAAGEPVSDGAVVFGLRMWR